MPVPIVLAALTLTLSDATSAQLHPRFGDTEGEVALDLQTVGNASLGWGNTSSTFSLGYQPSLGVLDVTRDGELTLTHGANAAYSWTHKRLTLNLSIIGSLGTQSYLSFAGLTPDVAGQTGNPPDPAAPVGGQGMEPGADMAAPYLVNEEVVYVGTVTGTVGFSYGLTRRWSIGMSVGYTLGGGLGSSADVIPRYRGPSASATATYLLTRRDTLSTSVGTSYTTVPTLGSRFISSTLLETWSHVVSTRTSTTLGAGVSHLRSRATRESDYEDSFFAAGNAGVTHARPLSGGATVSFTGNVSLSLPYNPLLGVVQQQLTEQAGVGWAKDRLSLGATVTAAQSLPQDSPDATRSIGLGAFAGYVFLPNVSGQLGGSWATQILPDDAGGSYPAVWTLFAGISVAAPPITVF
jgi:hypothetical protein